MEDNLFFVDTKGNAKNFNKAEQKKRKIEEDNEEEKSTKKGLTSRVVIGEDRDSSDEEGAIFFKILISHSYSNHRNLIPLL